MRTTRTSRLLLTVGSALGLLNNPARGDLLSILTQVSSGPSLPHLLTLMRSTESGRRLLVSRPSINSETVDVDYLRGLERGKFGREWVEWLDENGVGPDGRAEAEYMGTLEEKYLIQRYRESHDFYHVMLGMPVTQLGETVVKVFEAAQMGMPVAGLAAVGGTLRMLGSSLSGGDTNARADMTMLRTLAPWAVEVGHTASPLIAVEWEQCWERDIDALREQLGITSPPIQVPKYKGRRKSTKPRGWPSKVLEARAAKLCQQQQQ